MRNIIRFGFAFILIAMIFLYPASIIIAAEKSFDFNTVLMRSTFKILGQNNSTGTIFILGRPIANGKNVYVLVTATHVLEGTKGDTALVFLRKKVGGNFKKLPVQIKIRENGKKLWVNHANADVAAMYIALPKEADILTASTDLLATDDILKKYDIYPGRELKVLGYPFGLESSNSGFPILRTGCIASYPITPSIEQKIFLMDFDVFGGNSGGPVYFHDPDWHKRRSGLVTSPVEVQMILGLVSKQRIFTEKVNSYMQETTRNHQIGLAEVVHASLIRETIELLPNPLILNNRL